MCSGGESRRTRVAVVLLNYNGWRDTLACVRSLQAMVRQPDHIIICDNGSADGSLDRLRDRLGVDVMTRDEAGRGAGPATAIHLIDNAANLGFAGGNNVGIRFALRDRRIDWVWLLNNDTEVDEYALPALLDAARARPAVGLWGATIVDHADRTRVQALAGGILDERSGATRHLGAFGRLDDERLSPAFVTRVENGLSYVLGASMFVGRPWLEQIGLMSERYFLYYEELDWAFRARGRFAMGYAPRAVVFHREGASIGTAPQGGSRLSVFHLHRSRMLFCRAHLPRARLPAVIVRSLASPCRYLVRGRSSLAAAAVRGLVSGWSAHA